MLGLGGLPTSTSESQLLARSQVTTLPSLESQLQGNFENSKSVKNPVLGILFVLFQQVFVKYFNTLALLNFFFH